MQKNPILDLPLTQVMRREIALPLQHVLQVYTVGGLLNAWRNPSSQKKIEQVFDSPEQARHAVGVCATWLGVQIRPTSKPVAQWWLTDEVQPTA
jgi:hypothetical protein